MIKLDFLDLNSASGARRSTLHSTSLHSSSPPSRSSLLPSLPSSPSSISQQPVEKTLAWLPDCWLGRLAGSTTCTVGWRAEWDCVHCTDHGGRVAAQLQLGRMSRLQGNISTPQRSTVQGTGYSWCLEWGAGAQLCIGRRRWAGRLHGSTVLILNWYSLALSDIRPSIYNEEW